MKFRSPTDEPLHVALTTGHTCTISPEGEEIPQIFHREAISRGAIPGSITAPETAHVGGFDRKQVVTDAINAMLDGGNEDDFTNNGKPDLRKLQARVGFKVEREEADAVWAEVSKAPDAAPDAA